RFASRSAPPPEAEGGEGPVFGRGWEAGRGALVTEKNRRQETGNRQQAPGNVGSGIARRLLPVAGLLSPVPQPPRFASSSAPLAASRFPSPTSALATSVNTSARSSAPSRARCRWTRAWW